MKTMLVWSCLLSTLLMVLCPPDSVADILSEYDTFDVTLRQGYRNENLDWSIAGSDISVLSELIWDDLDMAETSVGTSYTFAKWAPVPIRLSADLGAAVAFGGEGRDSDYLGDNRTMEFSRSLSRADGSYVIDFRLGVGAVFEPQPRVRLIPQIGYYYHRTAIELKDGVQTVSMSPSTTPLGPFPGLDSRYDASWHGPWIGVLCQLDLTNDLFLNLEGMAYLADYYAEAKWNLRSDFANPSFEQSADGAGVRLSVALEKHFDVLTTPGQNRDLSLAIGVVYDQGGTGSGKDTVFFADGSRLTTSRLNEVNWSSFSAYLALKVDL